MQTTSIRFVIAFALVGCVSVWPSSPVWAQSDDPIINDQSTVTEGTAEYSPVSEEVVQTSTKSSKAYPSRYTDRPLTMTDRTVRLDGSIRLERAEDEDIDGWLILGGAISFAKRLELGISPQRLGMLAAATPVGALPLRFFDEVDLGELPFYLRVRVVEEEKIELAVDVGVTIPLEKSPDPNLFGAVLLRLRPHDQVIVDTGADFAIRIIDSSTITTLTIPAIVGIQFTDILFGSLRTGLIVTDFDSDQIAIPLGVEAGVNLGDTGDPIVDLIGRFEWPGLFRPGAPGDDVQSDIWALSAIARFYIPYAQN